MLSCSLIDSLGPNTMEDPDNPSWDVEMCEAWTGGGVDYTQRSDECSRSDIVVPLKPLLADMVDRRGTQQMSFSKTAQSVQLLWSLSLRSA